VSRYLQATAPIAPDALLPSDPALAMRLAQELIASPRMSNHHHGLWGYSGRTPGGLELTIQSTGIGGPSAAAVLGELSELGVRRAIRLGEAIALHAEAVGTPVIVGEAVCDDGTSRACGAGATVTADSALAGRLAAAAGLRRAVIASCDVEPEPDGPHADRLRRAGAVAADLETAALLAAGKGAGVAVASVVLVRAPVPPARERLEAGLLELGALGVRALAGAEAATDVA
jgi:uridine phosphorylase